MLEAVRKVGGLQGDCHASLRPGDYVYGTCAALTWPTPCADPAVRHRPSCVVSWAAGCCPARGQRRRPHPAAYGAPAPVSPRHRPHHRTAAVPPSARPAVPRVRLSPPADAHGAVRRLQHGLAHALPAAPRVPQGTWLCPRTLPGAGQWAVRAAAAIGSDSSAAAASGGQQPCA